MYIIRLSGIFAAALPTGVVLDVQGVGYGIELPLSTLCQLPKVGQQVSLWIYSHVREDAIRLFGFLSYEDRLVFETLLSLNGVGPKVALAILSTLNLSAIERAVLRQETTILESVPGVGPRLAERIIVELKPKINRLKTAQSLDIAEDSKRLTSENFEGVLPDPVQEYENAREALFADLSSALENLGYKDKTINPLLASLRQEKGVKSFQDLMRAALRRLSQGVLEGEASASRQASSPSNLNSPEPVRTPKKKARGLAIDENELF